MPNGGHSRLAQFEDCPVIVCDTVFKKLLIMMIILMGVFQCQTNFLHQRQHDQAKSRFVEVLQHVYHPRPVKLLLFWLI